MDIGRLLENSDSHTIVFHTGIEGKPGKNYVFYKANIMGYCIEEMEEKKDGM